MRTYSNNHKYNLKKDTTTMSNEDQPSNGKSTKAAQQNKISHRDRVHPWHLPYLKTCIITDCRTKPYYDGSTYFTCCLSCLREKELGPFYKNKNPRLHNAKGQFKAVSRTVTVANDGVVTATINSDDL